jgi:hypothetical protein
LLSLSGLRLVLRFDCGGKIAEARIENAQESEERRPADAPFAALNAADESCVGAELIGDLFLCEPGAVAELGERAAERKLILRCRGAVGSMIHCGNARVPTPNRARVALA